MMLGGGADRRSRHRISLYTRRLGGGEEDVQFSSCSSLHSVWIPFGVFGSSSVLALRSLPA